MTITKLIGRGGTRRRDLTITTPHRLQLHLPPLRTEIHPNLPTLGFQVHLQALEITHKINHPLSHNPLNRVHTSSFGGTVKLVLGGALISNNVISLYCGIDRISAWVKYPHRLSSEKDFKLFSRVNNQLSSLSSCCSRTEMDSWSRRSSEARVEGCVVGVDNLSLWKPVVNLVKNGE